MQKSRTSGSVEGLAPQGVSLLDPELVTTEASNNNKQLTYLQKKGILFR